MAHKFEIKAFPSNATGVVECNPESSSVGELKTKVGAALNKDLSGHRWYWVRHRSDSIPIDDLPSGDKLAGHGILAGGTIVIVAPAKYRPPPQSKRAGASDDGKGGESMEGMTPDKALRGLTELKGARQKAVLEWIDDNAEEVLKSPAFLKLSNKGVALIFARDNLSIEEGNVFETAVKWAKAQGASAPDGIKKTLGPILKLIRFPAMSTKQVASQVVASGLVDQKQILDLFTYLAQREGKGDSVPVPESWKEWSTKERVSTALEQVFMYPPSQNWTPGGKTANCTGGPSNICSNTVCSKGQLRWKIRVTGTNDFCIGIIPVGSESSNYYLWNSATIGFRNSALYGSTLPQRAISDQTITVTLDMNKKQVVYQFDSDKSTVTQSIPSPAASYRLAATLNSPGVISLQ